MNNNLYSNKEFTALKEQLNQEILRRGTYKWWDPLTTPSVGEDKTSPLTIPKVGNQFQIDEKTYTINNPSEGSIEPTRNIKFPSHGENPGGKDPDNIGPNTSAAHLNVDEMKNLLIGLSKIQDINLFYGKDEIQFTAFRDPKGIEDALIKAQNSELNSLLHESDIPSTKNDPNGNIKDQKNPNYPVDDCKVTYPKENGKYVMPSGESDGEEIIEYEGLGVNNFYDDYGAQPGDGNFHPYNRFTSQLVNRDQHDHDNNRNIVTTKVRPGGLSSDRFGKNPRNPNPGNPYPSRNVYGGKEGSCVGACTGLCFMTCDNECNESCFSTCWNRCGESCTATCGNVCTGCSTMCYTSCKTKCENSTGYACVKAGAKTIKINAVGGKDGIDASNKIAYETYTCNGCSYSCQFYPNKKTECWDAGCMGKCFTSCNTACSTSCFGGCVNNNEENTNSTYQTGKGKGCSGGCTLNCIGECSGVCIGYCVQTCWHACKSTCSDNCSYTCSTNCGAGCDNGCKDGCTGCSNTCKDGCTGKSESRSCVGCGAQGGCTSTCQFDCNKNCMGWGCRSLCGIDNAGSCESNCRLNCTATSCTALCSDACSSQCSTCVNTCGFQCGACSSMCSTGCGAECNITCTENCSSNCSDNCVHSCTEECGGCSNLCYSCIGMCIGVCSVKCENGCSSCSNQCSFWCDSTCNQQCFGDCNSFCISNCSGSCSTTLYSETTMTTGPEREPTSEGYIYPHPKNRWEERESFKLFRDPLPYKKPKPEKKEYLITIKTDEIKNIEVIRPEGIDYITKATTKVSGVWQIDSKTGDISVDIEMLNGIVSTNNPNIDGEESLFFVILLYNEEIPVTDNDIEVILPFGFTVIKPFIHTDDKNIIVIISRELPEYFPGEEEYDEWHKNFHQ